MQIISVSRGSQSLGVEFANRLSEKLGYECISREDIVEAATSRGIAVGKIETAIVKPHQHSHRLAAELEHFKAFATSVLCEKALDHDIVYHGRTGHLLLRGVNHILKIRVVGDMEHRVAAVEARLHLPRKKAQQYVEAVEEDRRRWVREFYNVDWNSFTEYDVIVNLSQVNPGNAATAACALVELPEFHSSPASVAALKDLLLASRARLALAEDDRTRDLDLRLVAASGIIHVTYSFQQARRLDDIAEVLHKVPGIRECVCTQAQTNILWIQEEYARDDNAYNQVLALANRWDAAVEILQVTPSQEFTRLPVNEETASRGLETWRQTGIMDDDERGSAEPADVSQVYERLVKDNRAGGKRWLVGSAKNVADSVNRAADYRLVILDNLFLSKNPEARKRMTQEWANALTESLRMPIVSLKEIQARYRFGIKEGLRLAVLSLLVAAVVYALFRYEQPVLAFLAREGTSWRVLATACIALFVPVFALLYSAVAGLLLRSIHLD